MARCQEGFLINYDSKFCNFLAPCNTQKEKLLYDNVGESFIGNFLRKYVSHAWNTHLKSLECYWMKTYVHKGIWPKQAAPRISDSLSSCAVKSSCKSWAQVSILQLKEEACSTAFLAINQSINERSIPTIFWKQGFFLSFYVSCPVGLSPFWLSPFWLSPVIAAMIQGLDQNTEVNQSHFTHFAVLSIWGHIRTLSILREHYKLEIMFPIHHLKTVC